MAGLADFADFAGFEGPEGSEGSEAFAQTSAARTPVPAAARTPAFVRALAFARAAMAELCVIPDSLFVVGAVRPSKTKSPQKFQLSHKAEQRPRQDHKTTLLPRLLLPHHRNTA